MSALDPAAATTIAADIVAAYVTRNSLPVGELPGLIATVRDAVALIASGAPQAAPTQKPAVPVNKSVTPAFIVCLDDGLKFQSMKRHLSQLGMTPDQYRAKWGLSADYPMVAPEYAAKRSALAKSIGLGQINTGRKRGRPPKAK